MIACTRDCFDTCIFRPVYRGGKLEKLVPIDEFPTLGFTCARGVADVKRLSSPKRIKRPVLRGERQQIEVSWSRALEELALRIRETHPEEVLHIDYDGNQGLLTWYYPARLFNALGAASTDYSICSAEGSEAIKLHWGRSYGAMPEELGRRPVVFWALDAATSFIHGWALAKRARNATAAVDVVWTATMKNVDLPVLVKPGTDVVLALGIAREIILRGEYDRDFVDRYTYGFDKFVKYVETYTPEYVEAETGVRRETLFRLVEFYLRRPVTVIGFAIGRTENGGEAARAISLIHALLGDPAGFYYSNSGAWGIDFAYLRGLHMAKPGRVVNMGLLGSWIDDFDIIYVWNANPVLTLPQGNRLAEAAARGDVFLAVHTPFIDETAEAAHLVLPAPTYLEKDDVVYSYWHNYLVYNTAVAEPPGEARRETWVVAKLAELLGLAEHPLMREDPWEAVDKAIRGAGVTLKELKERGYVKLRAPDYYNFSTATGKVEFYSVTAERRGLSPLPQYKKPQDALVLTFPPNPLYTNSQFRDIYGEPPPRVYMNPRDYVGDCVVLYNEQGEVVLEASPDPSVPPGVVVYRGIGKDLRGVPINAVARGEPGLYGGTPKLYTTYVNVRPCERSN
ncbi:molybdopterin oxidoreductase [Pyrobaculum islandicum DSM 4184]|uniref:Molybdopterin oxidoreductase n=1 Tax=Pyrobaculum islandicum (strain DSM 4184 / JCM 9189 / GEO3) TaxID=384616 RepID=A1RVI8_PYRIL|nr:molybdopterin-dependent oxidoreductase [Pyrobaculum islandicum]ABL88970.1 molybdopterin oxidoreductase [Pyrobaculum islandicum DSM 4184]